MMERKEFKTQIRASKEIIWDVLWNDATYADWTAPFIEGAHVETDWQEGSDIKFLCPNGEGMLSKIKKCDPYTKMYFEHFGIINNGKQDTESENATQWKGMVENYTLKQGQHGTELQVETDIPETYLDFFEKAWPKSLQKVKELSEKQ